MGAIGQRVASIAEAFGCHVIYYSTSGRNTDQPYERVDFEELLKRSEDVYKRQAKGRIARLLGRKLGKTGIQLFRVLHLRDDEYDGILSLIHI